MVTPGSVTLANAATQQLQAAALDQFGNAMAAQPTFGNPSPTAGSQTSQKANAAADQAVYQPVAYTNVNKKGPALIVITLGGLGSVAGASRCGGARGHHIVAFGGGTGNSALRC